MKPKNQTLSAISLNNGQDSTALDSTKLRFFQEVLSQINEMVVITNARPNNRRDPEIVYVNEAFVRISGYSAEEVIGKTPQILAGPKTNRDTLEYLQNALVNCQACRVELLKYKKNGEEYWVELEVVPLKDEKDRVTHWVRIERDVTERKNAESEALERQEKWKLTLESAGDGVWDRHVKHNTVSYSKQWKEMLGYADAEIDSTYDAWSTRVHPDDIDQALDDIQKHFKGESVAYVNEHRLRCKNGNYKWILSRGLVVERGDKGEPLRFIGTHTDISSGKKREQELLLENQKHLELVFDAMAEGVVAQDCLGKVCESNHSAKQLLGISSDELNVRIGLALWPGAIREDFTILKESDTPFRKAFDTEQSVRNFILGIPKINSEVKWLSVNSVPLKNGQGKVDRVVSSFSDISERRAMEESLRVSERRMKALIEATPDSIFFKDHQGRLLLINKSASERFDLDGVDYYGKTDLELAEQVPSRRGEFLQCAKSDEEVWLSHKMQRMVEILKDKDQVAHEYDVIKIPLFNGDGSRHGLVVVGRDVTESRNLQEQLKQAQKMEAVGQLAGGIAHDFNNTLAAILLNLEYLESITIPNEEAITTTSNLKLMVDQASGMTRQLLMFSRKNAKKIEVFHLNESLDQTIKLLSRLISSTIKIQRIGQDLDIWIEVDKVMFNQTIMNLCLNARDAMPRGGRIRIETSSCKIDTTNTKIIPTRLAGNYACIKIYDDGVGMDDYTKQHLFEPFFSKKEFGKGTGLGLATVYGIMEQHQGWVEVESEIGEGSTFTLYFPQSAAPKEKKFGLGKKDTVTEEKVLLLVEDIEFLRKITANLLRKLGYEVLEAANSDEALKLWELNKNRITFLFTDVIMPGGINGTELARIVSVQKPSLRVIITSGYNLEMIHADWAKGNHFVFLPKPYELSQLEAVLEQVCLS